MLPRLAKTAIFILALTTSTFAAKAEPYPAQPVRVIVPFTVGSPVDIAARIVSRRLQAALGKPFIVENRPGAGTTIGTRDASRAAPDGYTLLFTGSPLAYYEVLYPAFHFDPTSDLAPIGTVVAWSHVMVVRQDLPVKTVAELVDYARRYPGQLKFGFGLGTPPHILAAAFTKATGADIILVTYRGGEQARSDLLGGHIDIAMAPVANLLALIRRGDVRAIGYTGTTRAPDLPAVPTMAESGYPHVGFDPDVWLGLFAPPKTPSNIIAILNSEITAAAKSVEVVEAFGKLGFEPKNLSPSEFGAFLRDELKKWPPRLLAAGLKRE